MSNEVWILGGTGRTGRAIGARVAGAGVPVVLVGRDGARLAAAASGMAGVVSTRTATDVSAMAAAVAAERPLVVVNTVGPYPTTAALVAGACLPHSSYVDLANDVAGMTAVLDLDAAASEAGRTLVTGAAFGVLATGGWAVRRIAAVRPKARPRPREHSWGRARVEWADGTVREGFLRMGDASDFSAAAVSAVTIRLARGGAPVGATTPAAAFGDDLVREAGGELLLPSQG